MNRNSIGLKEKRTLTMNGLVSADNAPRRGEEGVDVTEDEQNGHHHDVHRHVHSSGPGCCGRVIFVSGTASAVRQGLLRGARMVTDTGCFHVYYRCSCVLLLFVG